MTLYLLNSLIGEILSLNYNQVPSKVLYDAFEDGSLFIWVSMGPRTLLPS